MKTVVVGIDGSEYGEAALEFAAREASLHEARLLIISAWEVPSIIDPAGAAVAMYDDLRTAAETIVQAATARVKELQPEVAFEAKAVAGYPATVLLKEAERAAMVVVGSRGRGGFSRLLLGSVSQQLVYHASCPVVVVR